MDKRIAVVALALLVVAGAFLAWPSAPVAGAPAVAGGSGETPTGRPMSTDAGTPPPPEPETEITIRCKPMRVRIAKLYDEDFAKKVGVAAKAKFGTDDAVIAECDKHINLTDDQLKSWVENDVGVKP